MAAKAMAEQREPPWAALNLLMDLPERIGVMKGTSPVIREVSTQRGEHAHCSSRISVTIPALDMLLVELTGAATHTVYIEGPLDYIWYDEPFMCVAPDNWWIFASRVELDGFARIIRSPDRGRTWEPLITTPVWSYPQHLLPLCDGRLLMSYGYRRPPYGVCACLSRDNGKTWDIENEIVLRMDGGAQRQHRRVGDSDLG